MKLQVLVSDELVERVDKYAKKIGVSRSSLCALLIGQGIMGYEKSFEMLENVGNNLSNSLIHEKKEN